MAEGLGDPTCDLRLDPGGVTQGTRGHERYILKMDCALENSSIEPRLNYRLLSWLSGYTEVVGKHRLKYLRVKGHNTCNLLSSCVEEEGQGGERRGMLALGKSG